ncbi:hypothetical protein [Bacillus sp. OTU530]|uniref:hypothetical protein n=1 Tax=Bacillus sp. OTU530 TaxID=3043862 RepID=UPI00313D29AE
MREVCPVSFSLDDPYEKQLYEHAKKQVFSKYVKRLIAADMMQQPISPLITSIAAQIPIQEPEVHSEQPKTNEKPPVNTSFRSFF